jgi:hypothetical protein
MHNARLQAACAHEHCNHCRPHARTTTLGGGQAKCRRPPRSCAEHEGSDPNWGRGVTKRTCPAPARAYDRLEGLLLGRAPCVWKRCSAVFALYLQLAETLPAALRC